MSNIELSEQEYMTKLEAFVRKLTDSVKVVQNQSSLTPVFGAFEQYYK